MSKWCFGKKNVKFIKKVKPIYMPIYLKNEKY